MYRLVYYFATTLLALLGSRERGLSRSVVVKAHCLKESPTSNPRCSSCLRWCKGCPSSCSRRSPWLRERRSKGCPTNHVHKDSLADPEADALNLRLNRRDLEHCLCLKGMEFHHCENLYWSLSDLSPADLSPAEQCQVSSLGYSQLTTLICRCRHGEVLYRLWNQNPHQCTLLGQFGCRSSTVHYSSAAIKPKQLLSDMQKKFLRLPTWWTIAAIERRARGKSGIDVPRNVSSLNTCLAMEPFFVLDKITRSATSLWTDRTVRFIDKDLKWFVLRAFLPMDVHI